MYIMLTGIPGSGKTTLRNRLMKELLPECVSVTYVSSDEIRQEVNGDEASQENGDVIWKLFYERARAARGDYVILDATFLSKKDRRRTMSQLGNRPFVSYTIIPDLNLAKERNALRNRVVPNEIIESMYSRYSPPTENEGFKFVLYFNSGDLTINDNFKV